MNPKIKHTFTIKLNHKQTEELRAIWTRHGEQGGGLLMQARLDWGPFTLKDGVLAGGVLNKPMQDAVIKVWNKGK